MVARLENQRRLFLELIERLRPHWRRSAAQPALLRQWLAAHRAGSRDRRLYRELAYTTWHILPWVEHAAPDELVGVVAACAEVTPATADFIAAYRMEPLPARCDPARLWPDWLAEESPGAVSPAQQEALQRRAPVWIRLRQANEAAAVEAELTAGGWIVRPALALATAWRVEGPRDLTETSTFQEGRFEIQDLGSQLLLEWVRPQPGEAWLDACAGAGGKSLQLASLLGPDGQVHSHDIRPLALRELAARARRAGAANIQLLPRPPEPDATFDGVLVDAPCTGSGTWRRAPHLKWVVERSDIARAAARQQQLLERFSGHVRRGGRLVYATCSLCRSENEAVVQQFLERRSDFAVEPLPPTGGLLAGPLGLSILPADLDTDAFFVSALRRR